MALVYRHRNPKTLEVFYVGISCSTNINSRQKRPFELKRRSQIWKNYVSKHGEPIVEIIQNGISNEDAKELEIFLISEYGRRDLETGTLVNLTGGGEGTIGWKPSKEYKDNASIRMKGKFVGKNNPMYGKKFSKEQKLKLSKIQKGKPKPKPDGFQTGELNHRFGKGHLQSGDKNPMYGKGVKFKYHGKIYNSYKTLERELSISKFIAKSDPSFTLI